MRQYLFNILVSLDQFLNTIFAGDPDETISSRCGKILDHCVLCKLLCKTIHLIDSNHCEKAIEYDEGRRVKRQKNA